MDNSQPRSGHINNIVMSVAGTAIPLVAGVAAVPMLLAGLGSEKLGLFTLGLALFGFTGLFDLGLGRALTRTVAHEMGHGRPRNEVAGLISRGLAAILALGLIWGAVMFVGAHDLASTLSLTSPSLRGEAERCIRVLAWLVPLALLSSGINGSLEGVRAFRTVNSIRAPLGVATYLGPAFGALATNSLYVAVIMLALARVAGLLALFISLNRAFPRFWSAPRTDVRSLWRYSGWLTVSNSIGPLMTTADRYYLAVLFSPAVIASYTVAFDTIYRLTAFPFAAISAIFPSLSNPKKTTTEFVQILDLAVSAGTAFWLVPLLVGGTFAGQILTAWMGADFASGSTDVARWIIAGVLINGFALIPFMILQADGHVSTTIKFYLLEIVPYAAMLFGLTKMFGVVGAAAAWGARVAIDAILQFTAVKRLHPDVRGRLNRLMLLSLVGPCLILLGALLPFRLQVVLAVVAVAWAVPAGMRVFQGARSG